MQKVTTKSNRDELTETVPPSAERAIGGSIPLGRT